MFVVLSGAKKNVGDFLITHRAKQLINHFYPDEELIQYPNWQPLTDCLDIINSSKAVIILGGPGYQQNMYPGIYKFVPDLNHIKPPIVPLGLGWKGISNEIDVIKNYKFSTSSHGFLNYIQKNKSILGCRDFYTEQVLNLHGYQNTMMTGCPAWYDLDSIGKPVNIPGNIKSLIFTPPQNPLFRNQGVSILRLLNKMFPSATKYCVFHRGLKSNDEFTPTSDERNNIYISNIAKSNKFEIIDAAYDLNKINFYNDCDIHIGYRIHAHLYFLSKRKPSIVINEDARGNGIEDALGIRGIDAYKTTYFLKYLNTKADRFIRKTKTHIKAKKNVDDQLHLYLSQEIKNGFKRFEHIGYKIDRFYPVMEQFIKKIDTSG